MWVKSRRSREIIEERKRERERDEEIEDEGEVLRSREEDVQREKRWIRIQGCRYNRKFENRRIAIGSVAKYLR